MAFNLDIPLFEMERLEEKYDVELFVEQYGDPDTPSSYWQIIGKYRIYLGCTIDQVEKRLGELYGE